jgi:hypothetical protein
MKTVSSAVRLKRVRSSRNIAGSGLPTPTSPEITTPSISSRNANIRRVVGNVSVDQLLRA